MTSVRHTTIHHPSRTVFNQISSVVYLRDTYCPACCGSGSYPPVLVSCVVTNYRSGGGKNIADITCSVRRFLYSFWSLSAISLHSVTSD